MKGTCGLLGNQQPSHLEKSRGHARTMAFDQGQKSLQRTGKGMRWSRVLMYKSILPSVFAS